MMKVSLQTTQRSRNGFSSPSYYFLKNSQIIHRQFNFYTTLETIEKETLELPQQHKLIERLFKKYKLTNLDDFLTIPKTYYHKKAYFVLHMYSKNIPKLLSTLYPNYPWDFEILHIKEPNYFNSMENQRKFMENLFIKLNLNSKSDWLKVRKSKFVINGGKLLLKRYLNDIKKLLTTTYPDYNFNFDTEENKKKFEIKTKLNFKSIEVQRKFMDNLFIQFKLISLDDWLYITKQQIIDNGGKMLIHYYYESNMEKLLKTIYPEHTWNFTKHKKRFTKNYFQSINNQKLFMDYLFKELNLKSIDDWLKISKQTFHDYKAEKLLKLYSGNVNSLLYSIYPNHQWNFDNIQLTHRFFQKIENQRYFTHYLYKKLELTSLDDWKNITKSEIKTHGGKYLLTIYNNNKKRLLRAMYPNHKWKFMIDFNFKTLESRRKFMDVLYKKLKLQSLNDWARVTRKLMSLYSATVLLTYHYKNDMKLLLEAIYPNYPWKISDFILNQSEHFKTLKNQQSFLENIFYQLNYNNLDDFMSLSRKKILDYGGQSLLVYHYGNNLKKLLSTIFPNYPWDFDKINYYRQIENQRKIMQRVYEKHNLNSLDDFLKIANSKVKIIQWKPLLKHYKNDFQKLLETLYPDHPWEFNRLKFKPNRHYSKTFEFNSKKLKFIQKKYNIREIKDWYRLTVRCEEVYIARALKVVYPNVKWERENFRTRGKKSIQRSVFGMLLNRYSSMLLLENYRHPFLLSPETSHLLEIDIFIPALNLGIEYQGEQHYDDIPFAFSQIEVYKTNDEAKKILLQNLDIRLVSIPFWWDKSEISLLSSIDHHIKNVLL